MVGSGGSIRARTIHIEDVAPVRLVLAGHQAQGRARAQQRSSQVGAHYLLHLLWRALGEGLQGTK